MLRRPHLLLLVLLGLLATGCLAPGAEDTIAAPPAVGGGAPTFAPEPPGGPAPGATPGGTSGAPSDAPAPPAPAATSGPGAAEPQQDPADTTADDAGPPQPDPTPGADDPDPGSTPGTVVQDEQEPAGGPRVGAVEDPAGDLAGDDPERAPAWADVVGATIRLDGDRGEIVLRFAAPVPRTGRDGEAVNVATFYDLTGDGRIDREIWASQTSDGWGTSYWDRQAGTVRFAAEDEVEVAVEGTTVRLSFPASHLADAATGRWQVTLEWVDQALLTQRLAVDDAPDDRGGARWGPATG